MILTPGTWLIFLSLPGVLGKREVADAEFHDEHQMQDKSKHWPWRSFFTLAAFDSDSAGQKVSKLQVRHSDVADSTTGISDEMEESSSFRPGGARAIVLGTTGNDFDVSGSGSASLSQSLMGNDAEMANVKTSDKSVSARDLPLLVGGWLQDTTSFLQEFYQQHSKFEGGSVSKDADKLQIVRSDVADLMQGKTLVEEQGLVNTKLDENSSIGPRGVLNRQNIDAASPGAMISANVTSSNQAEDTTVRADATTRKVALDHLTNPSGSSAYENLIAEIKNLVPGRSTTTLGSGWVQHNATPSRDDSMHFSLFDGNFDGAIEQWQYMMLRLSTRDLGFQMASFLFWVLLGLAFFWWCKKVKIHLRYREVIPGLGKILLQIGVDKNASMECNIIIHEVSYTEQLQTYIMVQAMHCEEISEASKMGPSQFSKGTVAANFHDAISLTIPQGCTDMKFKLLDKDKKTVLAEGTANVDKMFALDQDDMAVVMLRKGRGKKLLHDDPRCMISCFSDGDGQQNVDGDDDDGEGGPKGPPPEKVLLTGLDVNVFSLELRLEIEKHSRNRVKHHHLEGEEFTDKEMAEHQLDVVANGCAGKLVMSQGFWSAQKQYFFCIYQEDTSGSFLTGWNLGWWDRNDKPPDCAKNQPLTAIPILYIGKIYPDPNKADEFTVEYVKTSKDLEPTRLHLCRVDRSRELWVESLSVFINHLRKVRTSLKDAGQRKQHSSHGSGRHKSRRSSDSAGAGAEAEAGESSEGPKQHRKSRAKSRRGGTDTEGTEEEPKQERKSKSKSRRSSPQEDEDHDDTGSASQSGGHHHGGRHKSHRSK